METASSSSCAPPFRPASRRPGRAGRPRYPFYGTLSGTVRLLLVQGAERRNAKGVKIVVGQVVGHGDVRDDMAT